MLYHTQSNLITLFIYQLFQFTYSVSGMAEDIELKKQNRQARELNENHATKNNYLVD